MSYQKNSWSDGDIITAGKLNNIENGVESVETNVTQATSDISTLQNRVTALEESSEEGSTPADYQELVDDVASLKADLNGNLLNGKIRSAILQLALKVAYIDDDGQTYYDALHDAFYPPAESISAVYTQSGTVSEGADLDTLKPDLVVTATFSDQSTKVLTPDAYTLSGTLTKGTSTITITYGERTTTFSVTVSGMVIQLTQDDIYRRYVLKDSYKSGVDGYYEAYAPRMCYPFFDIPTKANTTYEIVIDWDSDYDLYAGAVSYGSDIATRVANHSGISTQVDTGWQHLSELNGTFEIESTYDSAMRMNFKLGSSGTTNFSNDVTYINSITISEKEE